ncbi:MAG: molybdopterin dinucleotide binding domain-containing protein, partial [Bacillota bacterium]|nr:molybdopterin dinucleotide binding domain-containing protein [Bacillota bacterium]
VPALPACHAGPSSRIAWPLNRRILYNRCSADPSGKPWSQEKALIWWDPTLVGDPEKGTLGKWTGKDVPDFNVTLAPHAPGGQDPFIMLPTGVGGIFAAMNEGPFPEHYEPWESPVKNLLSSVQVNPVVKVWEPEKQGAPEKFPIVATTYRVAEHWQAGAMTRNLPWLAELVPAMFVEVSESLAKAKGIRNGQKVIVSSARGEVEAIAVVTPRLKPLVVNGQTVEQVGLIWHFGYQGFVTGDIANKLTPHIGDGNTMIPEYKAFLVDVRGV